MPIFAFAALAALGAPGPEVELTFPRPDGVVLRYEGKSLLSAHATWNSGGLLSEKLKLVMSEKPAEPMYLGYPHGPKTADWVPKGAVKRTWKLEISDPALSLDWSVSNGEDRRPCLANVSGTLASTFGSALPGYCPSLYDRPGDWLLETESGLSKADRGYAFSGGFSLKTDYYRDHLGYFLWDKTQKLWPKPVAGWCSWAAYEQGVKESDVVRAAEFFSKNLKDYGYNFIQIDDGYQRVLQLTDNHQPITEPFADYWTKPNEKFPHGMDGLAQTITKLGMTPGVWIGLYLPLGLKHADSYVLGSDGKPLQGPWVGYSMDSGKPEAVAEAYTDALKTFRKQGWRYFKIDTLRHVLYDSYRRVPEFWTARGTESSYAYRKLFEAVREAVGRDNYLLACWGALPELAGLPDGCRIGEDVGPSYESMKRSAKYIAQFHYANDVIWRNDPDYMCFRVPVKQCQTWATLTSLTGEHVMVSDPVETYDAARVDILRRVGPPAVTKPANVAPARPNPQWVSLFGSHGSEEWTVVGRLAWQALDPVSHPLIQLGLATDRRYLAFDFWDSKFLGVVRNELDFHALAPGACQVVGFRPFTGVPQILGDDRHISQGAYELDGTRWDGKALSGRFRIGSGRAWSLYFYVPEGFTPEAQAGLSQVEPRVWKLTFEEGSGWKPWSVRFQ